jgi:alpha-galactosidase
MANQRLIEARYITMDLPATDLSDAAWEKAQPVQLDHYWSGRPAPVSRQAGARILWSEAALHLRFVGNQVERLIVNPHPQAKTKTMGLWDRDVCEIFIAPDPTLIERYFEFEAAPTGEWLDVAIDWAADRRESDWKFNSGMTTAGKIEKDRVTIGMRIPWSEWIPKPQRNERWRINLMRCVGEDPDRGYVAWQPTRTATPNFHVPQVFGWLAFK